MGTYVFFSYGGCKIHTASKRSVEELDLIRLDGWMDGQTDRQAGRQRGTDRQRYRQTDKYTDWDKHIDSWRLQ